MIDAFPPGLVLIIGAALVPALPAQARGAAFLVFPALALALLARMEPGATLTVPFLTYELVVTRVDRLALAFGYVFALIALLGGIYSYHMRERGQQAAALVYAGSALGVVFAGDLFTLVVFWEVMAVASVYLIWARRSARARGAGVRYLLFHLVGGSLLLAGVLLHIAETGSIAFQGFTGGPAAWLVLLGFAVNAAVVPLHAWLPDAYPEATVTGSVFLSAFTTKSAVYTLARGFDGWEVLVWAGVLMAVFGVVMATLQNDIRRLLSYHIVSQVGYMVAGVGLGGALGINGATAHAFAHILYKALLFMGAGTLIYATTRSKLSELGGLARVMPAALALYMVGAFSISGVPLFSGFVSKSLVTHAAEVAHREVVYGLLYFASVGTFLSVGLKLPYFAWFGGARSVAPAPVPRSMYVGMGLTAALNIAIGVYPRLLYDLLPFPVDYTPYTATSVAHTVQLLGFTALGFWLLLGPLAAKVPLTLDVDWLYRRHWWVVERLTVAPVNAAFGAADALVGRLTRAVAAASANPVGAFAALLRGPSRGARAPEPPAFDPDRYRSPLGNVITLLLLSFVVLLAWLIFGLGLL